MLDGLVEAGGRESREEAVGEGERENHWGSFMGDKGDVMVHSQVSGLGSGPGR